MGKEKSRAEIDEGNAAIIRAFNEDTELKVNYLATAHNPYRGHDDIDIYDDEHGFEYWVDTAINRLVQACPRAEITSSPNVCDDSSRVGVEMLRKLAVSLATKQLPDFEERSKGMHPVEDNRRGQIFFFRWEQSGKYEFDLPPFVQVGLYADGTLACFTNTLTD